MLSSQLWACNTLWQVSVWKNNKENTHCFLVKWFYSWREARGGTTICATSLHYLFHLLVRAEFSSAVSVLVFCQASEWPKWWIQFNSRGHLAGMEIPSSTMRISCVFQLASVCFVCDPKCFLSSLSICTLQMFADSYHIISPSPHPHPGLLAKLYIFSSFNLSS